MRRLIILGCTGSIGSTALEAIREVGNDIQIVGLSSNSRYEKMLRIALSLNVRYLHTPIINDDFELRCRDKGIRLYHDLKSFLEECQAELVLNAISGFQGLDASIDALATKKDVALANKESIVMAGELLKKFAKEQGKRIIPVDSEHCAIYCLLKAFPREDVSKLIITASGGPFRTRRLESLSEVTVEQAASHPTWRMGRKISIDSATLANKALEVIEAGKLFDFPSKRIITVIHPQSTVHSMIGMASGQTYAQLSKPTMRFPIMNAIYEAFSIPFEKPLNTPLFEIGLEHISLDFYPMDFERFPMVKYGYQCLDAGGYYPMAFNASNEVAVQAFCDGRLRFDQIPSLVDKTLNKCVFSDTGQSFESVFSNDSYVRNLALEILGC